ncbi:hypothetical protein GRI58_03625 [Porphyrobacter algicida]|uniref:Uncharacterized protein n=1 Tax=Qipengyuania algicida TaxID=1836209 RepID=A0A845AG20_9SPHN|nr:hypothetical protein [Qipengyuania algicida]MXP27911.1 hypothetical protein [Qipengyuania algicida]
MNAPAKLDDIQTFMGEIPAEEYERRTQLRSYRNAASAMVSIAKTETAMQLAWLVVDRLTPWLYAPASTAALDDLLLLCKRLMAAASQVENMDLFGPGAIPVIGGAS